MKRAAVKRKKASSGGKRNAPRRRSSVKATATSKSRSPAPKRKARAKTKIASSRKIVTRRKTIVRRPTRRTTDPARAAGADLVEDTPLKLLLDVAEVRTTEEAAKVERKTSTKRQRAGPPSQLEIPPILFEGDEPDLPSHSGPGEKFSLGPETPAAHFAAAQTYLPASYGTGRLFLAARDPHWIYAYWDINPAVQFQHNARSQDRHLILRMHERDLRSKPAAEIHVHPESRHWFAHVERADEQYVADLGYYQSSCKWKSLATSRTVRTPPDSISSDAKVEFATIPAAVPFETMLSLVKEGDEQELPLAHAIEQLRDRRLRDFPPTPPPTAWTSEQARALAEITASGKAQKALLSSLEITGAPIEGLAADFGDFNLPSSLEYVSSPLGGQQTSPGFWFKVNAELTLYGSTEPNAKVLIGGKEIPLQPDGSFSFRFALPDGRYEVPIVAVSADTTDARGAQLTFSRVTQLSGEVGAQPQDPGLQPPGPDAI
jgi:hypothetical protein